MSRSKQQGTAEERRQKLRLEQVLGVPVVRLVEGGLHDRGDLAFHLGSQEIVVECRDRQTMEVHRAIGKAKIKGGMMAWAVVLWKRKALQPGNQVRTQVGPPVAIMLQADWEEMAKWAKIGLERHGDV